MTNQYRRNNSGKMLLYTLKMSELKENLYFPQSTALQALQHNEESSLRSIKTLMIFTDIYYLSEYAA